MFKTSMTKHLILMRHAKAENAGDDKERPLSPKGRNDLKGMVDFFKKKGLQPDKLLYSSAKRTAETAQIMNQQWKLNALNFEALDQFYLATAGELMHGIQKQAHDSLMIVAHNPGIHKLALLLLNPDYKKTHLHLWHGFLPASTLCLTFPIANWQALTPGTGTLQYCKSPGAH